MGRQHIGGVARQIERAGGHGLHVECEQQLLAGAERSQAGKGAYFVDEAVDGDIAQSAARVVGGEGRRSGDIGQCGGVLHIEVRREHSLRLGPQILNVGS